MSRLPLLDGRAPSQVGILVDDLEAALERYDSLWGGGPWRCYRYAPDTIPTLTYRGRPGTYSIAIAINATTPQIELVRPLAGPSIYEEWIERRGPGLHHVCFQVENLDTTMAALQQQGIRITDGPTTSSSGSRFIFIDAPDGYEVELIERPPGVQIV